MVIFRVLIPSWFFGIDIGLAVLFAAITIAVAVYAFRIGRLTDEKEPKLFGAGFLFIALSYLSRGLLNLILVNHLSDGVDIIEINELNIISHWSVYLYIIFFTIGLITLIYMTLKTKKDSFYPMLLLMGILPLALISQNLGLFFNIFATIALVYLDIHYMQEYRNKNNPKVRNMLIAFVLLTIASIDFSFASGQYIHYVISHIFELAAYLIILFNLVKIGQHEQKKK